MFQFGTVGLKSTAFRIFILSLISSAAFSGATVAQTVTLQPNYFNFGSVVVGTSSPIKSATLTNTAKTTLSKVVVSAFGDFSQTNNCGRSVPAKSSCIINIVFAPTAAGLRAGILAITDNVHNGLQVAVFVGTGIAPQLTSIAVSPANASISLGTGLQFAAIGRYSDGKSKDLTNSVTWASSAPNVSTVNQSGLATSAAQGSTSITATLGSVVGSTRLTVVAPALTAVTVSPSTASISLGTSQQFIATGIYTNGSTKVITTSVSWSSSVTAVAVIGPAGVAQGNAVGATRINASSGSISGSASLTITPAALVLLTITPSNVTIPAGVTQQFVATGTFTDGSSQDLTSTALWKSSDSSVASVGNTGKVTAISPGAAQISASAGGLVAQTSLTVGPASLVSIALLPNNASIALGTKQQYAATGTYSDGSTRDLTASANWTSGNSAVASISTSGLANTRSTGATTITATSGAVYGATTLSVTAAALVSIAITPAIPSTPLGETQQFTATGTFTDGTIQDITQSVNWSSSDPTIATISMTSGTRGLASTLALGAVNIVASSGGVSGNTTLTVTAAALTSIVVNPSPTSLASGTKQQLTATGNYSDGTSKMLTAGVNWSSSDTSIATVSASGVVSAVAVGNFTVTATSGVVSGQGIVSVTPAVLVSIAVNPSASAIPLGTTQQFTATGNYTDGTTQDLTSSVQWTSSDGTVATTSMSPGSAGLTTSKAIGSVTVSATSGSISGTATLTVTPAQLVSIAIIPGSSTISLGQAQQFTATGTYTDASTKDITTNVTWSTSNALVAVISNNPGSNGLATSSGQGAAAMTATLGTVTQSATLTVGAATLVSIALTPANPSVPLGAGQQFTATGTFTDGSTQNLTTSATWNSSAPAIASIDPAGLATSITPGSTVIRASVGSISATTTFTVSAPALVSLSVLPANVSIAPGAQQQFNAIGSFTDGSTQDLTSSVTWSCSAGTVASISPTGVGLGLSPGTTTIQAASGSITGTTTLNVVQPVLALVSIALTPASPTIASEASLQFTAIGIYNDGSTVDLTKVVAWSSATLTVATIASTGVANGVAPGSTTIMAASSGVTGSTTLTVGAKLSGQFAYVANASSNNISAYAVEPNSASLLTPVPGSPFAIGSSPHSLAVNASGDFLYATSNAGVFAYSIDASTGALTEVPGSPFATGSIGDSITVVGSTVLLVNRFSQNVSRYNSDPNSGALTPAGGPFPVGPSPSSITVFQQDAFITDAGSNTVEMFNLGGFNHLSLLPTGTTPSAVAVDPTGEFVYVANAGSDNVSGYTFNPQTGSMGSMGNPFQAFGSGPSAVVVEPLGRFAYVANKFSGNLSEFSIQSGSGALTFIKNVAAGTQPNSITLDPSDNFFFATNAASNDVWAYSTDPSGSAVIRQFPTGTNPVAMSVAPARTSPSATLLSIQVTPAAPTIRAFAGQLGKTQQFTARGIFSDGSSRFLTSSVTWSSSDTSVATISNAAGTNGLATSTGFGSTSITATYGSVSGSTNLSVHLASLVSIAITPANISLPLGVSANFTASGTYDDGSIQDLTTLVAWSSASTSVGTVDASGLFIGTGQGSTTISATLSSVTGSTIVKVGPPIVYSIAVTPLNPSIPWGSTQQFTAVGSLTDGSTQDITNSVTWSSSATSVAGISASGVAIGRGQGTTNITAQTNVTLGFFASGSATLSVGPVPLKSIAVTPANFSLTVGTVQQFAATGTFADNSTKDLTNSVTWSSSATNVALAGNTGLVSGAGPGFTIIRATSGPISGTATLRVTAALISLTVTPSNPSITLGGQQQFTATGTFSDGSTQDLTNSATWNSSATNVATISATGIAAVVAEGSTTVTANTGSVSGSTVLTVTGLRVAYVVNTASNNISGYRIDAGSGTLSAMANIPFATGVNPVSMAVAPSGQFTYVANSGSNDVSAFSINATTGALTPVPGSPFAAGTSPSSVTVDPSGKFVYVANSESHNVSAYTINASTGVLTKVAGSPFAAGSGPQSVQVDPSGKFAFVANMNSSSVSSYTIDSTTGALALTSTVAGVTTPVSLTIDPLGRFAYVVNSGSGDVSAYTIDAASGVLTGIAGSFATGTNPSAMTIDHSGTFAYVVNSFTNDIATYNIDTGTGALTSVGSPVSAGVSPNAITLDPTGNFLYATAISSVSGYAITPNTGTLTAIVGSPFVGGTTISSIVTAQLP